MTPLESRLLRSIRAEVAKIAAIEVPQYGDRFQIAELREQVNHAKDGILRVAELLGGFSDTERRAASRALEKLEAAGRIERLRLGYASLTTTHPPLSHEVAFFYVAVV